MLSRSNFFLAVFSLASAALGSTAFVVSPGPRATVASPHQRAISPTFKVGSSPSIAQRRQSSSSSTSALGAGLELVDPNYNLAIGAFGIGLASGFLEDLRDGSGEKLLTAKPFGAFAVLFTAFSIFLAFQTTTLRFAFDDDSFSLVAASGTKLERENVVVGGENRWRYDSFKNYDFLPSRDFPILVYFREDQTPVENREEVPLIVDTLEGQVHFFPAISNSRQLEEGFLEHKCQHL
jgi:NIMA (never in mitosis gene a)-related kinase